MELSNGELVTAHCPNTGSMTGCWEPGAAVQLSASDNPKRKLKWTLERVDMGSGWIGVNTNRVNQIIRSFLESKQIQQLSHYSNIKAEPTYQAEGFPKSRFDFLLQENAYSDCYIEVKNTTLFRNNEIQFPDAVTTRGRKHLQLLQHAVNKGHRGIILYAVNRPEGDVFRVASDIDPEYHNTLIATHDKGVEIIALRLQHTDTGVMPGELLPVSLA